MSKIPKNKDTLCRIYVLICPVTLEVRYVGKTIKSLRDRWVSHLYSPKVERNHRANWIKSLLNEGKQPLIEQIDECPWSESQEVEKYWIQLYKERGARLVNLTAGGEGNLGRSLSQENIEALRRINSIPICQYSLEGVLIQCFPSSQEAARQTNSSASKIIQCCKGNRNKHNKSIWRYEKKIS